MREGIIYKATNVVNGKVYIGQTVSGLDIRRRSHINDSIAIRDNIYFHNAIRKYSKNSFVWEEIESGLPIEDLNDMEYHYIKQYNSKYPNGYNLTEGGGGMTGYTITDLHRKNLSESHRGHVHTADHKLKISKSLKGRTCSAETRKLLSYSKIGQKNHMYGKTGVLSHSYNITPPKHVYDALVNKVSKEYTITFPDGHEEVIKNLAEFCRKYSLNKGNLCAVAHGRRPHHKGFKCKSLKY